MNVKKKIQQSLSKENEKCYKYLFKLDFQQIYLN